MKHLLTKVAVSWAGLLRTPQLERFALEGMVEDLRELLDCEGVDGVFAAGA